MANGKTSWDDIYKNYPQEIPPWELGIPRPSIVELIEKKKVIPQGKALDICCGLGTNTIYLAESGFEVTGIDISSTAIDFARQKTKRAGVDVQFMVGDVMSLTFPDEEFDFISDIGCFHHIHPTKRIDFIAGIKLVLKKAGHYFMFCFSEKDFPEDKEYYKNNPPYHFSKKEIKEIFSPYFEILEMNLISSKESDAAFRFFLTTLMTRP